MSEPEPRYYEYEPALAAAVTFVVLFLIISVLHTYQLLRTRTWVFIPFVIGGFFEVIGYIGRLVSATQTPDYEFAPFVLQTLTLLVAPALFAASIYMVLGRIILLTDGESHSVIKKKWLTKLFVTGDVVSFFTQVAGGTILANAETPSDYDLGETIVIVGLVVQIVVFGFFVIVAGLFHIRMLRHPSHKVRDSGNALPWQKHLHIMYATSILILVRSIFRFVEYLQGHDGFLLQNEWTLYVFDATLMWCAMVVCAWGHPSEVYALLKGGKARAVKWLVVVYAPAGVDKESQQGDGSVGNQEEMRQQEV